MTLSLKSTITGLAKLGSHEPPSEEDLETVSQSAFKSADLDSDSKISFEEFRLYCVTCPETKSYLDYFDSLLEDWGPWDESTNLEVKGELSFEAPSKRQTAADMGYDFAGLSKPEITALFINSSEEMFAIPPGSALG